MILTFLRVEDGANESTIVCFPPDFPTDPELLHPENILKRGYSITLKSGKALRNAGEVLVGGRDCYKTLAR